MRSWDTTELEKLISWMEHNQELLRGSTNTWTRKLKDTVFADYEHIDVKKIKAKYHNFRTSWKAAKKLQDQSGFGLKEDDCEASINGNIPSYL
jgi:hypothetical protein